MVKEWDVMIPKLTGNQTRKAYLYLPESYLYDKSRRYPVLYMFDGHNVFFDSDATYGKCWGLKEYMDYTNTELIIAAVECNHSPDNGRLKEYSPYDFSDPEYGTITGLGDLTMDWMIHTFKKEIDRNYPTLPDRENTFIAGSSMGGLMSLYAVLKYNRIYSRAAALSPSIWAGAKQIADLIRKTPLEKDTVIYMDYGSKELANHAGMLQVFCSTVDLLMKKKVFVTSRIVPGGTHCEASWEKQLPFMIHTLMYEK